jgi:predicted dienelactone hydrolase
VANKFRHTTIVVRVPRIVAVLSVLVVACSTAPSGPGEVLWLPDNIRSGTDGALGPRGASLVSFSVQSRVTERLSVQVIFPSLSDGTLDVSGAPYPVVVFVQGGNVERKRYHWLASHLATRGYVVAMPDHPFNLSILETDNSILALRALREAAQEGTLLRAVSQTGPVAVMGHSLGGVIASRQWIAHNDFTGVVFLASYPIASDDLARRAGNPVLLMAGSTDVPTPLTRVREGFEALREPERAWQPFAPRLYALVDGLNHYTWTDSPTNANLESDGPRPGDPQATRANAMSVVDTWLDTILRRDDMARARLETRMFRGVVVQR